MKARQRAGYFLNLRLRAVRRLELVDRTPHAVGVAVCLDRFNPIIVSRPGLQLLEQHAERHFGMTPVAPVWRLGYLREVLTACTVVRYGVVKVRAFGIFGSPTDDRGIGRGPFDCGPINDAAGE